MTIRVDNDTTLKAKRIESALLSIVLKEFGKDIPPGEGFEFVYVPRPNHDHPKLTISTVRVVGDRETEGEIILEV